MALAELNEARREAKALGITGAHRMKLAEVREAIAAAKSDASEVLVGVGTLAGVESLDDERKFAEAMEREENEQDTPEAAAAYENAMNPPMPAIIGTCEGCGEAIEEGERHDSDDCGLWCETCMVMPEAGPNGVVVNPLKGDGTDDDSDGPLDDLLVGMSDATANLSTDLDEIEASRAPLDVVAEPDAPRADCADPECAAEAVRLTNVTVTEADAVETRKNAQDADRRVAELLPTYRVVRGPRGNHLQRGRGAAACGKAVFGTVEPADLARVDCLGCLDAFTEALRS